MKGAAQGAMLIAALSLCISASVAWNGRYRGKWTVSTSGGFVVNQTGEAAENVHVYAKGGVVSALGQDHFDFLFNDERADLHLAEGERQGAISYSQTQVIWTRPKNGRAYILGYGKRRASRYAPRDRGFHEKPAGYFQRAKEKWF